MSFNETFPNRSPIGALIKRDRVIVILGLVLLSVLAWLYLSLLPDGMTVMTMLPWTFSEVILTGVMWVVMMVAMMLPSASPMILSFAVTRRKRNPHHSPILATSFFLASYLVVWTLFSVVATALEWQLHDFGLLSGMTSSITSPYLAAGVLIFVGVFQLTPLKNACLSCCRSPLEFVMSHWRDGKRGAFIMGLQHGAFCLACCWGLMALLFVVGVMNVFWVAVIAFIVLVERLAPAGSYFAKIAGISLTAWGAIMITGVLH